MFLPTFIKFVENGVNVLAPPATSAAKLDEAYYPTEMLNKGERQQAMALLAEQNIPEGSIFVVSPGDVQGFEVVSDPEQSEKGSEVVWSKVPGRQRGEAIVEEFLQHADWSKIETVVIPGCGSSPLGAAALAKSVAEISQTGGTEKVAAILAGQGAFDQWLEAASGGMLMAPMANVLNTFDPFLEWIAKVNPVVAKMYLDELLDAIHEAATLNALLRARLVDDAFPKPFEKLNMVVSHSKGNWAVLVALLAFELELPEFERAGKLKAPAKRIDIVTLGNPVDLPDMHPSMKKLFHYHQFVGAVDKLAHNTSMKAWKLHFSGAQEIDPSKPVFDTKADPDERMFANTEHHLFAKLDPQNEEELKPYHMPIEKILPLIRQH